MAMTFGQMGMNPVDFWQMSWRDFKLKQRGFFERLNSEYRTSWEQARLMAFYSVSPYAKKGHLQTAKDLFIFDWEKEELPELTEEQMDYYLRKLGKFVDDKGNFYNA